MFVAGVGQREIQINSLIDCAAAWAAALSFRGILSMVGRYAGEAQMGRNSCFAKGRSFSGGPTSCKHGKHEMMQTRQTHFIAYDVIRSFLPQRSISGCTSAWPLIGKTSCFLIVSRYSFFSNSRLPTAIAVSNTHLELIP